MSSAPRIVVSHLAGEPGRPILVVGPSLGTRVERLWSPVSAVLNEFHVLGWDLPGHGRSPRAATRFGLDDLAQAVLASVDHAVGAVTGSYLYAGDSVGGAVGLQLALNHPKRLAALAVLCSGARFGTPEQWAERAALVRAEGMAPMVASSPGRWFGSRLQAEPTELSRVVIDDLAQVDPESYAMVCDAIGQFDVTGRLGEVAVPLLAVAGADDAVTPPADHQALADKVPHGRFTVLRGVGHLAPLEDPRRTAALLRRHYAAVTAGRAAAPARARPHRSSPGTRPGAR